MNRLTILSPHRDDAVFSLAFWLDEWRKLPLEITVVNFFTLSDYGPRSATLRADSSEVHTRISMVRAREDKHVLNNLDPSIRVRNCSFVDAPLRRRASLDSVFRQETIPVLQSEVNSLVSVVRTYARRSLILSPLGLGNHVDHLTVRAAALAAVRGKRLGFYEDAPYVRWTSEEELIRRLSVTQLDLRARTMVTARGSRYKQQLLMQYQSQLDRSEAGEIANYRRKLSVKERIWTPTHSEAWRRLMRS